MCGIIRECHLDFSFQRRMPYKMVFTMLVDAGTHQSPGGTQPRSSSIIGVPSLETCLLRPSNTPTTKRRSMSFTPKKRQLQSLRFRLTAKLHLQETKKIFDGLTWSDGCGKLQQCCPLYRLYPHQSVLHVLSCDIFGILWLWRKNCILAMPQKNFTFHSHHFHAKSESQKLSLERNFLIEPHERLR